MGLFPILPLSGAIVLFILAVFVYTRNKSSPINFTYMLSLSSLFLWLIGFFFSYLTKNQKLAYFCQKVGYSGVILIPSLFYSFSIEFLGIKKLRFTSVINIGISIAFIIVLWISNLLIDGIQRCELGFYYLKASTLQLYFLVFFILCFVEGYILMISKYREHKKHARLLESNRILIVMIAILIGNFASIDFVPMYGVKLWPFGFIFMILMVSIFAYAIVKHQLMGIKVIIKKTLVFAELFTAVYAIFAFFAFLGQIFFERFITGNRWVSMIPSVIVVTVMLRPLESFLVTVTDKYLFQKKYDYRELLKAFASEVLTVLEIDKLIKLTKEKLSEIMKLEYCDVVVDNKDDKNISSYPDIKLRIPIALHNEQIGMVLLGKKKSDEEYSQDDIDILQPLSKTLAIAISNAKLVDELTKTQAEMVQKDKMATIGTLAAGMAHEIRNPITTIRVFSEYVPDRLKDAEFTDKYRNTVIKEVDKIDHIIQTLIDFSGDESLPKDNAVSVHDAIQELLSMVTQSQEIAGRIEFINKVSPELSKIRANKEELDEIVLNLTQNAMHAITGKGIITFTAEEKGGTVVLEITDTGCGMSEETVKHIFAPFFTTKSKGFGLGLFVVRELIERNKGEITVESVVAKGTKFKIKFNRA